MIYLDYQATTPCDPRVLEAMWPWFAERFGNPHSSAHAAGREAADAVEQARAEVASLIGAAPSEIIFTSGATEANNLAIKGAARFAGASPRRRVITASTEHPCVLETVRDLAAEGFEPTVLPVDRDGKLPLASLEAALETPTLLVSIMLANNETGVIQDVAAITRGASCAGALCHSDLAQALGRIPVHVEALGIQLGSMSAHKIYGPKGVGALYVRRRPRTRIAPLFSGGGQERGLRSGTLPVPLIVGFGEACRIARIGLEEEAARVAELRAGLLRGLQQEIPGLIVNGTMTDRLPGNLNLRFPGVSARALIEACPEIAMSTGSACQSDEVAPSHVLTALGLPPDEAGRSLRLCIGRTTSAAEIDAAVRSLADAYARLAGAKRPQSAEA